MENAAVSAERIKPDFDLGLAVEQGGHVAHGDLRRKAEEWITANPVIYALTERFALEMASKKKKFGIALLFERVRWEIKVTAQPDEDGFKLNNNHRAYVARRLVQDHPDLAQFLSFRTTKW